MRSNDLTIGFISATSAYVLWAGLAIYFKTLGDTPPVQIMTPGSEPGSCWQPVHTRSSAS